MPLNVLSLIHSKNPPNLGCLLSGFFTAALHTAGAENLGGAQMGPLSQWPSLSEPNHADDLTLLKYGSGVSDGFCYPGYWTPNL